MPLIAVWTLLFARLKCDSSRLKIIFRLNRINQALKLFIISNYNQSGVNATMIIFVYCIVLFCILLHCIVLYCIFLYSIVLYCILLHCIVFYCIVLYFIALYCILFYFILLYCIVFNVFKYNTIQYNTKTNIIMVALTP